ncbi:MAG: spermidine/putrescine ABC transporter substrate-binding protein [Actinomycetota bacterium]|nr:spermidine/putrescine ABC transporter substrate-binding protein [Actinomycetota bacterium]
MGDRGKSGYERMVESWLRRPLSRRNALRVAAVVPAAVALAACSKKVGGPAAANTGSPTSSALESELNIYNWSAYLSPDNIKAFDSEHGVKATQDFYVSNEDLIAKLKAGAKGYDIIAPTGYAVEILAKTNLLTPLDHSKIPNLANADPRFLNAGFDPGNKYSAPKDWGTTGVGYLTDHVSEDLTSWAQFFDLAPKYSGKYTVLDSAPEVIGGTLKLLGYSYNSLDTGEVDAATNKLISIKKDIAAITSTNYRQMMQREETYVALGWNGDFFYVKKPHKYVIPSEGSEFWLDNWCIPAGAPHPNLAHEFINWILTPEHQATESSFTYYASCVPAAKPMIDPAVSGDPAIYPPDDVIAKLETAIANPVFQQLRNDAWTKFKSA